VENTDALTPLASAHNGVDERVTKMADNNASGAEQLVAQLVGSISGGKNDADDLGLSDFLGAPEARKEVSVQRGTSTPITSSFDDSIFFRMAAQAFAQC